MIVRSLVVSAAIVGLAIGCGTSTATPMRGADCPCACPSTSASSAASTAPSSSASVVSITPPTPSASAMPTTPMSQSDVARILQASEHLDAARKKMAWHDGAGCLAELDENDKLDPRPSMASTNPDSYSAMVRAQCMMLAGQCDAGRVLYRKAFTAMQGANGSPEQTEKVTDAMVGMYCHGSNLSPRDQVLQARNELQQGAWMTTKPAATCLAAYKTVWKYRTTVTPRDDDDVMVKDPVSFLLTAAPNCLARAGDCDGAWRVFEEIAAEKFKGNQKLLQRPDLMRNTFESITPKCKGSSLPPP